MSDEDLQRGHEVDEAADIVAPVAGASLDATLRQFLEEVPSLPPSEEEDEGNPLSGRELGGGKYRVEELIARGGMGAVYQAHDTVYDNLVAIKVLRGDNDSYAFRFDREALAMAQVEHTNILRSIESGQEPDGLVYIVMELLRGENLRQLMEREGVLPAARVAALMTQVCSGLSAAHGRGIIHRDVKPDNIMVVPGKDGRAEVKLCDFGLVKLIRRTVPRPSRAGPATIVGLAVGTPDYVSPEQARGEEVDARADIYSCGAVMYEMATGRVPFPARTPMATLVAHVTAQLDPPSLVYPRVDPRLAAVIVKAMTKDPRRRQMNALELRAELRALL